MTDLVPLRSLVASYIGGGWGKEEVDDSHTEPAYVIRGTDLADAEFGILDSVPYRFHKSSNLGSRRLETNEIVMEVSGGSIDQPVGRVMLVDEHVLAALDGPVMCASFCKRVVPDPTTVHPSYLYWYLQAVYASGLIERYQVQSTGIRNLQFEYLLDDLPVRLPSQRDQEQTAALLTTILQLLRSNRRRIKILEEMTRLIYREWFVHFRFPGHEDVELVDSDLGPIPEGWKVRPLSAVLELAYGKALKADNRRGGDVAVYGSGGIVGWHDEALVDGPGIVVGRKGNVGAVYWSDVDFYPIDTTYFVKSEMPLSFVYHQLQTLEFIDSHAAVPGLSRDQAYSLRIVVPARGALASFDDTVSPMYELRRNLIAQNDVLTNARDLLLPRLISGELDVSELDLDLESVA